MKNLFVILISLFLFGCSSTRHYSVNISSHGNYDLNNKRYMVIPGSYVQNADLEYKEYKGIVVKALSKKGAIHTDYPPVDIIIHLDYAISDPRTITSASSIPIIGNTGVKSSTTSGNARIDQSGNISYNETVQYNNTQGVVGYNNVSKSRSYYRRILVLTAYNAENILDYELLWQTVVYSDGSSNDLRLIFPALITAGYDYVGKSSNHYIEKTIYDSDILLQEIRGF